MPRILRSINSGLRPRQRLQDLATRFSRIELALAFLAAALLGGLLNALQEIIRGHSAGAVQKLALWLAVALASTVTAWAASRRYSLDVGACFVVRADQLENRTAVSTALKQATRSWLALEVVDDLGTWSAGVPQGVRDIAQCVATPLGDAVGRPRVLLALSSSDAVGFYLGNTMRASIADADIQILTLPTRSQSWKAFRYRVGPSVQRRFFASDDMSGAACQCRVPAGIGVIDPLRSPGHNPEVVLMSLRSQEVICCTQAAYVFAGRAIEDKPLSREQALEAARFLRARSRWLARKRNGREIDVSLTVGPEVSMALGFLLAGFFTWKVWEFDRENSMWKIRWTNA